MTADIADVYDEHVWTIYGFFAYRVSSRADAEDLTQLTFERALKAWHRYDESKASVATWLLSISRNLLIDHYRRDRSPRHLSIGEGGLDLDALPPVSGPEESLGLSGEVASALESLGPREREVLALRFGGDLTGPEIAEMLELSLANVQQILSRTLRKLRALLESGESERQPS